MVAHKKRRPALLLTFLRQNYTLLNLIDRPSDVEHGQENLFIFPLTSPFKSSNSQDRFAHKSKERDETSARNLTRTRFDSRALIKIASFSSIYRCKINYLQ